MGKTWQSPLTHNLKHNLKHNLILLFHVFQLRILKQNKGRCQDENEFIIMDVDFNSTFPCHLVCVPFWAVWNNILRSVEVAWMDIIVGSSQMEVSMLAPPRKPCTGKAGSHLTWRRSLKDSPSSTDSKCVSRALHACSPCDLFSHRRLSVCV